MRRSKYVSEASKKASFSQKPKQNKGHVLMALDTTSEPSRADNSVKPTMSTGEKYISEDKPK
jgi:hypothetical protein